MVKRAMDFVINLAIILLENGVITSADSKA
jgi:hypothetical protein